MKRLAAIVLTLTVPIWAIPFIIGCMLYSLYTAIYNELKD
jgi:hypothetical protein